MDRPNKKNMSSNSSLLFNDVYNLTDEYCAGCNNHDERIADYSKIFPLKKSVRINSDLKEISFDLI